MTPSMTSLTLRPLSALVLVPVLLAAVTTALPSPARAADEDTAAPASVKGVDPRVYLKARRPAPHAVRELKAAPLEVSLRILRQGPGAFLVDERAYPRHLKEVERLRLRTLEEQALLTGALAAVAEKNPPEATTLIAPFLKHADPRVRAEAAERLGQTRGDVVELLVEVARADVDVTVRGAACAGLGRHRSAAALSALAPFVVEDDKDDDSLRRVAAVRALGVLGSSWAWQARGDVATGERLRAEARALLARVQGDADVLRAVDEVRPLLR